MTDQRAPILWLTGPSGVGKTTLGREIFGRLAEGGVAAAFLDADQIGMYWPTPADDPDMHRVKARNLGEVWKVFQEAGARCLVLAGGIDTAEQAKLYADEVPDAALTVCRLRMPDSQLREQFLGRGWMSEIIDQILGEAAAMDRSDFADLCVDVGGMTIAGAAALVLERAGGWPVLEAGSDV